ncbi:cupin-like domain-containing protein [Myxococcus sp. RHSTA-1-4]|uniref:cupin-like domain-containing protein n=1 Tax=Myxococcus sp. RHSTA-1-4 TaxID=2874601 RepID=UPI001CC0EC50|nr:cupin-like domain-containing protein [Myxococcus sp. RHSTA-1-4]MBZ4416548.1 cupin-like domain-containing protein [Myxococcus sp. RHSTA-1-4]
MTEDSGGAQLAPEWRRWLVENLVRGAEESDLAAVLEGAGVDAALARAAVRAEAEDPCLLGTRKAVALHRKLEGLLDLYGDLHRQAEGHARVDRHESLSREDFFDRYYFRNRPVVLRGAVVEEPGRFSTMPPGVHDVPGPLRGLLRPPTDYVVVDGNPVLMLEAAGHESPDLPARENMLLCQVRGRWLLRLAPAFELRRMAGEPAEAEAVPRLEVELGPGEMVLLPVGWWYGYRVLEASASLGFTSFAASAPNVTWEEAPAPPEPTPPTVSRRCPAPEPAPSSR